MLGHVWSTNVFLIEQNYIYVTRRGTSLTFLFIGLLTHLHHPQSWCCIETFPQACETKQTTFFEIRFWQKRSQFRYSFRIILFYPLSPIYHIPYIFISQWRHHIFARLIKLNIMAISLENNGSRRHLFPFIIRFSSRAFNVLGKQFCFLVLSHFRATILHVAMFELKCILLYKL